MAKLTLSDITNLDNPSSVATINANSTAIETALENTLSRDGTAPNQMGADFDMNGHRILNLPAAVSATDPVRLQDIINHNGVPTVAAIPAGGTINQVLAKNSNSDFDVTWSTPLAGTVSSVGLSLPADFTVTNSPVTSSGTLTATWVNTPTGTGSIVRSSGPSIANITLTGTTTVSTLNSLTLPSGTDTLVGRNTTDTLTNKTLTTPVIGSGGLTLMGVSSGTQVLRGPSAASGTITLPAGTYSLVGDTVTQTLFAKSISAGGLTYLGTSGSTILAASSSASGTLTLPAATDTLVGKATIDTLTNKTYDTAGTGNVFKINGTQVSAVTGTGSAVLATSPTLVTPTLGVATVTSLNGLTVTSSTGTLTVPNGVTVARGQFPGENSTGNATAGNIGEYVSSTVVIGSAVALTTATPANITSISLTAGDWDVWVIAMFNGNTTTTITRLIASINTTSATLNGTPGQIAWLFMNGQTPFTTTNTSVPVGPIRVSLSSTTTVFFVAQAEFGVSTCNGYGIIQARRAR